MPLLGSKCSNVSQLIHKTRIITLTTSPLGFGSLYLSHFLCHAPLCTVLQPCKFLCCSQNMSSILLPQFLLHLLCPHAEPEIHMFPPSLRTLLQCHLFSEGFPNLLPPLLRAFPTLPPALLFSKALITTSKTTYTFFLICMLPTSSTRVQAPWGQGFSACFILYSVPSACNSAST